MTTHRHAFTLLSAVWLASGCDQPKPHCAVAPGDFAARYEKIDGNCDGLLGGKLSLASYYDPRSKNDQSPNFAHPKIALIPADLAGILSNSATRGATPLADDSPVAYGAFTTTKAGDDEYCQIPQMSTARVRVPAIPEETDECGTKPALPAVDEQYDFSDVRVYNSPGAYGTQLLATLRYRNATCAGTYRVTAVYPAIDCASPPPDDGTDGGASTTMDAGVSIDASLLDATSPLDPDGGQILPQEEPPSAPDCTSDDDAPQGPMVPDDTLCQGTGISPEFTASCDPQLLLCLIPTQSLSK